MKKLLIIILATLIPSFLFLTSCKSEKDKLVGEWTLEWSFVNGSRELMDSEFIWIIMEDATFRQIIKTPYFSEELKGDWFFDTSNKTIKFHYPTNGTSVVWNIIEFNDEFIKLNHTETQGFFIERKFTR